MGARRRGWMGRSGAYPTGKNTPSEPTRTALLGRTNRIRRGAVSEGGEVVVRQLVRSVTIALVLLLGTVVGAYLSFAAVYSALDPGSRSASDLLFILLLAALLSGLALAARWTSGVRGLAWFASVVLPAAVIFGLLTLAL